MICPGHFAQGCATGSKTSEGGHARQDSMVPRDSALTVLGQAVPAAHRADPD